MKSLVKTLICATLITMSSAALAQSASISNTDRVAIRGYLAEQWKKNNCSTSAFSSPSADCPTPGAAKSKYTIGQQLSTNWNPIPYFLFDRVSILPEGYRYVMVDKDVLLVSTANLQVLDAVPLDSAVN